MLYHFHRCLHRSIRDHSNAKTLLCWMLFPPWRPFKVRRHIIYQLDWPSSLLNKTYRNSQLSTNKTALSHDLSLPTIALIKTRYAALQYNNITQATTVRVWVWVIRTTPLTHFNFFICLRGGGLPGAGT